MSHKINNSVTLIKEGIRMKNNSYRSVKVCMNHQSQSYSVILLIND